MASVCHAAFSTVESVTTTEITTGATAHDIDMPATVTADDLLLVFFTDDDASTVTTPSGWTSLGTASEGVVRASVYGKKAVGDEDGTTVDFVTADAVTATAQVWRITGWGGTVAGHIDLSSNSAISNSVDPASVTAGWGSGDNLFIVYAGSGDDDKNTTVWPTDYDDNQTDVAHGAGANNSARTAASSRDLASASDDPGTQTLSSTEAIVAWTIVVKPFIEQAYPTVESVTATVFSSADTSHDVDLPAVITADDLLVMFLGFSAEGIPNATPAGWTELGQSTASDYVNSTIYTKKAVGDEDGGTVEITLSASEAGTAQVWRITDWGGTLATDIDISTVATGTTSIPNSTIVTAGWGVDANLFITTSFSGDDDEAVTAWPTDYDDNQTDTACGAGVDNSGRIAVASRDLSSDNDDAGAFTLNDAEAWHAWGLVVKPGSAGGGTPSARRFMNI